MKILHVRLVAILIMSACPRDRICLRTQGISPRYSSFHYEDLVSVDGQRYNNLIISSLLWNYEP
jgi:hypothetical protein